VRKTFPALLGFVALFGLATAALAAETRQGITASPYSQSLNLDPGSKYSGTVEISNPGNTEYDFTASAAPYSVLGEDYQQQFTARPDLVDASKWFSFPTPKYHLKPGQHTLVQFDVHVPADIAGGGYYATVFAQDDALPGPGVRGQKRVGVVTYMTVGGDIQRGGNLAGFSVPLVQTQPPLHTQVRLQDTGNVHFDSTVSVKAQDLFGNVKWQQDVDHVIMPKTIRKIAIDWTKSPSFGLYRVTGTVKYLGKTEKLSTRWTLMLSANAFLIIAGVLVVMGMFAYLTRRGRGNVRRG
jgi:hypothetical protein